MALEFEIGDTIVGLPDYTVVDKDKRSRPTDKRARAINSGSAGVVYRADFKGISRAIKFLSPDPKRDQQGQLPLSTLQREFEHEVRLLSTITHTSIVKIVDFGEVDIKGSHYSYHVMDYVEGDALDKFWNECSAVDFLAVIDQVLDALRYLHARGYYHMDVKEENIKVEKPTQSKPHAVLLDLGGAKQIHATTGQPLKDQTVYISTEKATRPERRDLLGKPVRRSQLAEWNVDLDLYSVGAMLDRALTDSAHLRKAIEKELKPSGLEALKWVVKHLTQGTGDDPIDKRYYRSAAQLQSDLARLLPGYTWPLGLPDLSMVIAPHSIQLPNGRVGLTPQLLEVINHPLFQRLGQIPQLEYVQLIYPGATKSRLEHVLSAFQLARVFLLRLLEDPEFRMLATPTHVQATLLAVLLHDIGHYPLSHMFEDFVEHGRAESEEEEDRVYSDDDLFPKIVFPDAGDEAAQAIHRSVPSGEEQFGEMLKRLFGETVLELLPQLINLRRASSTPIPMLHGVIDSAVDVDKIAYLQADSAATGVEFGRGLDVDGLVHALVPPRGEDQTRGVLAITENGLAAAEAIIMARFWMISRVYWHRANRAVMAMHKFVIADLIRAKRLRFNDYLADQMFGSQSDATAALAQSFDDAHAPFGAEPNKVRNPLRGIMGSQRGLYKRLMSITNGPEGRDKALYEAIMKEGKYGVIEVGEMVREHLAEHLNGTSLVYGDVLMDMPVKPRDQLGANILVYLDREPTKGKNLSEGRDAASVLLSETRKNYEMYIKKCRIFVHPKVMKAIVESGRIDQIRDSARTMLEDRFEIDPGLSG